MSETFTCIGGPLDGKVIADPLALRLEVPMMSSEWVSTGLYTRDGDTYQWQGETWRMDAEQWHAKQLAHSLAYIFRDIESP